MGFALSNKFRSIGRLGLALGLVLATAACNDDSGGNGNNNTLNNNNGGCGNGQVEGTEQCDEGLANSDQPDAACRLDCTLRRCGDSIVDDAHREECDGAVPTNPEPTCGDFGGTGGTLTCAPACFLDTSACEGLTVPFCGNGRAEGSEECDGGDRRDRQCDDFIAGTIGQVRCSLSCTFDASDCEPPTVCGNGVIESGELCDCGDDPANLPVGCTDVNGGGNANCGAGCRPIPPP